MTVSEPEFSDDILRGAEAVSQFLFGDPKQRRKVYHLAANSNLPTFKLGSMICARRTVLKKWVADQEAQHATVRGKA